MWNYMHTGKVIPVLDVATVTTNRRKVFDLLVAAGGWPSLIGRDWLYQLRTTIDSILAENKV